MKFELSDKVYDILCWITRLVLPGLGTLYFGIAKIWNLPYAAEVVGTISALTTFLACVLGISTAQWTASQTKDGEE